MTDLLRAATCTFEAFFDHLDDEDSPAVLDAVNIWHHFLGAGIDPAVALGFFHHESGCGTAGRAVLTKSWGNIRWRPMYATLPYPVIDLDGFAAYETWGDGARHFADHLLGLDGTNSYAATGLTVEEVVPIWAPPPTNSPPDYIAAVLATAAELAGGPTVTKPHVLICAGHVNIQTITAARIGQESADILRRATGSAYEAEWNADFAGRLMTALNASGLVDAAAADAIYDAATYKTWLPKVVLWSHFHRDIDEERAIFSAPDPAVFAEVVDCPESQRLKERFLGGYTVRTGIPVTQQFENPNTTRFYGYWYPEPTTAVILAEWGNSKEHLDAPVLWGSDGMDRIVAFARDCILEHLNLVPIPEPPTPPPSGRTKAVIIGEIRERLSELEAL